MTLDDAPAAVRLLQAQEPGHDTEVWLARFARDIAEPDKHPLIARQDGQVIGYARTLPYEPAPDDPPDHAPAGYYLLGLVVSPAARRTGIGTALTRARLSWIADRADCAFFYTGTNNVASQRMHEQLGFELVTSQFWFPALGRDHDCLLNRFDLVLR